MKIIDAHCHIFPDKIARFASRNIQSFYDIERVSFHGTISELIEQCRQSGVSQCVVSMVATKSDQPQEFNTYITELTESNKDMLIPLGTLHPESEAIVDDFKHFLSTGCKGIKLHPDMQESKADCKGYKEIYALCAEHNIPVLLHTGDSRYDNSNPDRIEKILTEFPKLTLIGAHYGGWSVWDEAAERLHRFDNFYVDTCSSSYMLTDSAIKGLMSKYGTDKIIFGTDYPIWRQEDEINRIMSLKLSDTDLEKIFHKNIEKLLNI